MCSLHRGRRRLLGPTVPRRSAPTGGRLRRCESSAELPRGCGRWEGLWRPCPQSCAVTASPPAWSRASPGSFASSGDYLLKSCSLTAPVTGFSVLQGGRRDAAEAAAGARGSCWHVTIGTSCLFTSVTRQATEGTATVRHGEGRRAGELARPPAPLINTWLI